MARSLSSLVPLFLMLSGCALTPYEHPSDASAPTLKFVNNSTMHTAVMGYADAAACKDPINISVTKSRYIELDKGDSEQIRIRPNEPLSFLVSMRGFPNECALVGTLTPLPSTSYVASISTVAKMCLVSVKRIQDGVEVTAPEFTPRTFRMPFSGSFSACADPFPKNQ
jgi:hypothetical protein